MLEFFFLRLRKIVKSTSIMIYIRGVLHRILEKAILLGKIPLFLRIIQYLENLFSILLGQFPLGTFFPRYPEWHEKFDCKVDNLDPTEDGEAGEEPHGAADEA